MKTNLGLPDETRLEVGEMLNLILADEYVLYTTTRDYHWNVTGPEFHRLHLQFEALSGQVSQWIDDVARRTRAIGAVARGNWAELAKIARTSAEAGAGLPPAHMLGELLALHEAMIVQLRADSAACSSRFRDPGTTGFLTCLMQQHEKTARLLRAQLATEEAKAV